MKHWRLLATGLGVYALALVATAPATLVDAGLRRASDGRLRLAEAQGTLWSGAGQVEIRDAGGRSGVARRFVWRVALESLLRGHLVCLVGLGQSASRFPVTLSLSGIKLAKANISLPAAVLGLAVPKLAPLGLTGDVLIHVGSLSISRERLAGNATLQWRSAGSALSPVFPLGDYELRIEGEGSAVRVTLHTLQGPLQLDGKGSWTHGDSSMFLAMARVPPQHQHQLVPLLRLIAVERGDGRFELQLK